MTRSWVGLALATIQLGVFCAMAVSFHRVSMKLPTAPNREFFGCMNLQKHNPDPDCKESAVAYGPCKGELIWPMSECRDWLSTKIVILLNLPLFVLAGIAAQLDWRVGISQVWVFYSVNVLGIPVFWYLIGCVVERRMRRAKTLKGRLG
jgi:hypothetical protein